MPKPLLPDWVIPAVVVTWAFVLAHLRLVKQGRLKGYSVVTRFCGILAFAGIEFVCFFVPWHWRGGAKIFLMGGCVALTVLFMAVTKMSPAAPTPRRWRKIKQDGRS